MTSQKEALQFQDLYTRYASWLRAALSLRYGAQEADDLLQEVWLRVVPDRVRTEIRHPPSFLLTVAANLRAEGMRSRSRASRWLRHQEALQSGFELGAQTDELHAKQIILGLPQPLRDVFVLSRFGGLTNAQIAEQLGIRPKTVEWRMTKALAHCAAQFRL